MTTYTFNPTTTTRDVDWGDEAIWAGGVAPNGADADVQFPIVYLYGTAYTYNVSIAGDESFAVRSIALDDVLDVSGTLSISQGLTVNVSSAIDMEGGTLIVGSLTEAGVSLANQGADLFGGGEVQSTGVLTVGAQTSVVGDGLSLDVGGLVNSGTLQADADLTVHVAPGGFTNLVGSTLTGGSYAAEPGVLYLSVGAVVTDIAANVLLANGGDIQSLDPVSGHYELFLSTVDEISASGVLALDDQIVDWGALTDAGLIALTGATLNSPNLRIAPGGQITGYGTIGSALDDEGTLVSNLMFAPNSLGNYSPATLKLVGPVTGDGVLEIGAGIAPTSFQSFENSGDASTLELGAAASTRVSFANNVGILQLDEPDQFTGVIEPSGWGDQIILSGLSFSAITGYAFVASGDGGTLTLNEGVESLSLNFLGDLTTANFALAAIAPALSTLPSSVMVTVVAAPKGDYVATAAALAGLTAGQIAALSSQGVTALVASDASVSYDGGQSAAIVAAGITLRAPAGDVAIENFADGSSKSLYFGVDGQLTQVVTREADGAFDAYFHGPAGNIFGVDYADYDVIYTAAGIRDEEIYYNSAGGVVATQDFTANGGYSLAADGVMLRRETVQSNGEFEIERCGEPGNICGVDYSNVVIDFAATGERSDLVYEDASGAPVAERTFLADGGFTLESGGVLLKQKTVADDGDYQVAVFGGAGASPVSHQNDFDAAARQLAHSADNRDGSGVVKIFASSLEGTSSGTIGSDFTFTPHAVEIYKLLAGATANTIQFDPGFGAAKLRGFATAAGDVVDLSKLFANFAAAMNSTTLSAAGATITDAFHDQLTLVGVTASSLTPSALGFG